MRKNVNIVLVAIAATTVFSVSGVESSMSGMDILAGRSLSDFICRNAAPETVAETFSLTNGVLTANAAYALVLESPERYDCESFVLSAEVRYESDGFADSGLQFCIEDVAEKSAVRRRMEYQLKTVDIGDGWGLGGIRAARNVGEPYRKPNAAGDVRMPRLTHGRAEYGTMCRQERKGTDSRSFLTASWSIHLSLKVQRPGG